MIAVVIVVEMTILALIVMTMVTNSGGDDNGSGVSDDNGSGNCNNNGSG